MSAPTRQLGKSDLQITVVGYGAWEASEHWGEVDDKAIVDTIGAAVDAGINWIDTAEVYGPHTSERLVGLALSDRPDVLVATKVAPKPAGSGFDKDGVRRGIEGSLKRLGRDRIDLYQLHWPDGRVDVEETWETMAMLVDEGLATAIGVSNFDRALIERCEAIRHVDSIQPHVSMLHRGNLDLVRWAGEQRTGAVAYSPLACGLLTGSISADTAFAQDDWRSGSRGFNMYDELFGSKLPANLERVERLRPIASDLDVSMADLAIAWVLAQPGITSAIVGSRNPAHVASNLRAARLALDAEVLARIASALS